MNIPYINIGTNNGSIQVADHIYNGQAAATEAAEAEARNRTGIVH